MKQAAIVYQSKVGLVKVWAILIALWLPLPASAFLSDNDARKAILDLRVQVNEGDRREAEELQMVRTSLLDLQNQINSLKRDLATLRGTNENLEAEVVKLRAELSASEQRLKAIEPVKTMIDGVEALVSPKEKQAYDEAMDLLRQNQFEQADTALSQLLKQYPQTAYRDSALFWRGNSMFVLEKYRESIGFFRQILQNAPKHLRAPEALVAIGNAQVQLKDTAAAKKTFQEVLSRYPESDMAQVARERLAALK